MVKVNFAKIIIKDIEGRDVQADFQWQLGNQLYMQGEVIIASNLLVAQQDFIRNGDSFVTITANRPNAPYQYTGIVQMWDPE